MSKMNPAFVKECRAHVRFAHALRSTCRPLGREGGTAWTARARDVSRSGIALVMEREVKVGTVLVVALDGLSGRFTRPILMRVVRVRRELSKGWLVGCTFVTPLSDHEVEAMLWVCDATGGNPD
jgi:PilZ domain-containing protein